MCPIIKAVIKELETVFKLKNKKQKLYLNILFEWFQNNVINVYMDESFEPAVDGLCRHYRRLWDSYRNWHKFDFERDIWEVFNKFALREH